jgi:YgiT-type zinc finger domain-containing protein
LTHLKEGKSQMVCDVCGQEGARIRRIPRTYGQGKDLLVIENIPVVSCPHCGESYFTADTLHEIERIKLHRKSIAVERPVEVARFV